MGYLSTQGGSISPATLKRALAYGTVVASYTIADFSLDAIKRTDRDQIDDRWHEYKTAMSFDPAGGKFGSPRSHGEHREIQESVSAFA